MQINRTSRLYRFAYWMTPQHRKPQASSLCVFVWRLVWAAIAAIFVGTMCSVLTCLAAIVVWGLASEMWSGRHMMVAQAPYMGLALLCGVSVAALLIGTNIWFGTDTGRVFAGYIKAKKEKVCPLIKFV